MIGLAVLAMVVAGMVLQTAWQVTRDNAGASSPMTGATAGVVRPGETHKGREDFTQPVDPAAEAATQTTFLDLSAITDTGRLQLINADHAVPDQNGMTNLVDAWPTVPVEDQSMMLDATALSSTEAMFSAAESAGVGTLYLTDAYRSAATQQELYDQAEDKSYVQTPGHSEHETGLAIDIGVVGMTEDTFTDTDAARWLADNAWRFGFILRYPSDGQQSTGIAYESWHYRYVGLPHAWVCLSEHLTLEQYVERLRRDGGQTVTLDGVDYTITYVTPRDGKVGVPSEGNFTISSDNTGGFIVTQWR
ncbi:MAG: M15 family metallopeptidase [Propionibacteriaceae bacterium]|jgi:D-alanyl-D-alanine carboxypeptidase|nr:M15 family metallopeptidase [Propionibacteriaceae bacterium]